MPLDFAVFGSAKRKLLREVNHMATWETRAERFVELLQGFNVKAFIESYVERLKYCAENAGVRCDNSRKKRRMV
jgi:hypothetical protein